MSVKVHGIPAVTAVVTSACREGHGDEGAVDEALARMRVVMMDTLPRWSLDKDATFFLVFTVDRDGHRNLTDGSARRGPDVRGHKRDRHGARPDLKGMLTLEEATAQHRCRFCGESTTADTQFSGGVLLAYGKEHAHKNCLAAAVANANADEARTTPD